MKNRPVQYFTQEYLESTRSLSKEDALAFVEDFQKLFHYRDSKKKLISLRVPENVLRTFRLLSEGKGKAYQTQIVELMREWILKH